MSKNWFEIATNQLIIKIIIGLILFLPIYGVILNYLKKRIIKEENRLIYNQLNASNSK